MTQSTPTLPNVFDPNCGSHRLVQLVADRWAVLSLYALVDGPMRNGEMMRRLNGVSQKMLTQTLRRLEHAGLVHRDIRPVVPPHVEYSLTELGRSLQPVLSALCEWSQDHADVL